MKLQKWIKVLVISGSIIALTACASHKKNSDDMVAVNDANAAYGAQASGLGDESGFGDQAGGGGAGSRSLAAKKVYYFDFDSNVVHDTDKPSIAANAQSLINNPNKKVIVEGHTDPRGSREYNIGLGERRAKSVAQLAAEKGANPQQIRVVSYGAEKLAANGRTENDYQQDRRVVLDYSN